MAITKLMHMKAAKTGSPSSHLKNAINYILNVSKIPIYDGIKLAISNNCDLSNAYLDMMNTKKNYNKFQGRQGYHFVISFKPGTATSKQAFDVANEFVNKYLDDYESVVAVHSDHEHIHAHIVFNSVSFKTGMKYYYANGDWEKIIQPIVDYCCLKYNLPKLEYHIDEFESESEITKRKIYSRNFNWTSEVKKDIDKAIENSKSWEEFIRYMKNTEMYRFNIGKYISIRKPGMFKSKRLKEKTMGIEYTPEGIIERINNRNMNYNYDDLGLMSGSVISMPEYEKKIIKKHKFIPYKDLNAIEKSEIRRIYRIRKAIPNYKKYPGQWYVTRNETKMHNEEMDLITITKFHITNRNDIEHILREIKEKQNKLYSQLKINEFRESLEKDAEVTACLNTLKKEMIITNSTIKELYKSSKPGIRDAINLLNERGYSKEKVRNIIEVLEENKITINKQLKDLRKTKHSLLRLRESELFEETEEKIHSEKKEEKDLWEKRSR